MSSDNGDDDQERVVEWEEGLPNDDDLTPLSQLLIPPELAAAFSVPPEPFRTVFDVNRASQNTLCSIRGALSNTFSPNNNFGSFGQPMVAEAEAEAKESDHETLDLYYGSGSGSQKTRKIHVDCVNVEEENNMDDPTEKNVKRQRLVWTGQLHKRFVDVISHVGMKKAVPKTIVQMMNVEGLTRENVASHLQKYRLYLKRMQGDEPSESDQLMFPSTPADSGAHGSGNVGIVQVQYPGPAAWMPIPMSMSMPMPMPGYGGHMGMQIGNGFDGNNPYNSTMMNQQRAWPGHNFINPNNN